MYTENKNDHCDRSHHHDDNAIVVVHLGPFLEWVACVGSIPTRVDTLTCCERNEYTSMMTNESSKNQS